MCSQIPLAAGGLDRRQVVGDKEQRGSFAQDRADPIQAALLEGRVAYGQYLVDEQDVRLQVGRDTEKPRRICMPEE